MACAFARFACMRGYAGCGCRLCCLRTLYSCTAVLVVSSVRAVCNSVLSSPQQPQNPAPAPKMPTSTSTVTATSVRRRPPSPPPSDPSPRHTPLRREGGAHEHGAWGVMRLTSRLLRLAQGGSTTTTTTTTTSAESCAPCPAVADPGAVVGCKCGKVKIKYTVSKPRMRLECCCVDCNDAFRWAVTKGGPKPSGVSAVPL
jgi:hypothetical protein